jgi:hypothetical protein
MVGVRGVLAFLCRQAAVAARDVGAGRPSRVVVDPDRLEIAMRSLYAGLGFVLLLTLPAAASAQRGLTITPSPPANAVRSLPDTDVTTRQYRRRSSQQELIFRRAARAAAQREARIQWRRRTENSASRPNMVFDQPPGRRYRSWPVGYRVTYFNRGR